MATIKPRFSIVVDEEINQRIEDYFYNNRLRSKSAAAVELIKIGLEALEKEGRTEENNE